VRRPAHPGAGSDRAGPLRNRPVAGCLRDADRRSGADGSHGVTDLMSGDEALAFVREHGVVLESAKGPIPRLTEAIVRGQIKGSWWSHPQSRRIFRVLQSVADSDEIFVCRLV